MTADEAVEVGGRDAGGGELLSHCYSGDLCFCDEVIFGNETVSLEARHRALSGLETRRDRDWGDDMDGDGRVEAEAAAES